MTTYRPMSPTTGLGPLDAYSQEQARLHKRVVLCITWIVNAGQFLLHTYRGMVLAAAPIIASRTDTQYLYVALLQFAFDATYVVGAPVFGMLAYLRMRTLFVLVISWALGGVAGLMLGLEPSLLSTSSTHGIPLIFFGSQVLGGFTAAGQLTLSLPYLSNTVVDVKSFIRAQTTRVMLVPMGTTVGFLAVGFATSYLERWNLVFLVPGAGFIVLGIIAVLLPCLSCTHWNFREQKTELFTFRSHRGAITCKKIFKFAITREFIFINIGWAVIIFVTAIQQQFLPRFLQMSLFNTPETASHGAYLVGSTALLAAITSALLMRTGLGALLPSKLQFKEVLVVFTGQTRQRVLRWTLWLLLFGTLSGSALYFTSLLQSIPYDLHLLLTFFLTFILLASLTATSTVIDFIFITSCTMPHAPMATALSNVVTHVLGDLFWPVLVGLLAGTTHEEAIVFGCMSLALVVPMVLWNHPSINNSTMAQTLGLIFRDDASADGSQGSGPSHWPLPNDHGVIRSYRSASPDSVLSEEVQEADPVASVTPQ